MGGQATDGMDARRHADGLAPQLYLPGAIDQPAAERTHGLEAGEHHVTLFAPEIVLEMMADASALAHAAARQDDRAGADAVDGHRLWRGAGQTQIGQGEHIAVAASPACRLLVVQTPVTRVYLGRFNRHRTVEKDGPAIQAPVAHMLLEQVQQFLRAPDGEGWNQDVAATLAGLGKDFAHLTHRVRPAAMPAVAVGRFHHHQVGLAQAGRVAQDRRIAMAEITAEHQPPRATVIAQLQLDDG